MVFKLFLGFFGIYSTDFFLIFAQNIKYKVTTGSYTVK